MTAHIIDGTAIARQVRENVAKGVAELVAPAGLRPGLPPSSSARTPPARSTSATSAEPAPPPAWPTCTGAYLPTSRKLTRPT
jgi:hypothetical protein